MTNVALFAGPLGGGGGGVVILKQRPFVDAQHIPATILRQKICGATTDNTGPDNNNLRFGFHQLFSVLVNKHWCLHFIVTLRHTMNAQYTVNNHILKTMKWFLEVITHSTSGIGFNTQTFLNPLDNLNILHIDKVPKSSQFV